MLFSQENVAQFVNRNFEPVWQSVRPVPIVRIDFGNGNVLTRTLHGNIATYVCNAEGTVLDILPGIYEPKVYLDRLNQFRLLANYIAQLAPDRQEARLREYHQGQAGALAKNQPPARFFNAADVSKALVEGGVKAMLIAGAKPPGDAPAPKSPKGPAEWKELAEDTAQNEKVRRRQIHDQLAKLGAVQPERVTKWLYKDVLHADLDDPYLGLGKVLFADYPFGKEDRAN